MGTAQIVVDDNNNEASAEGLEGDVDSRFFNINLGTLDLGQVAGTALGTTLGNLGTGFLNDCLGIGKRSVIMDRLVNKINLFTFSFVCLQIPILNYLFTFFTG